MKVKHKNICNCLPSRPFALNSVRPEEAAQRPSRRAFFKSLPFETAAARPPQGERSSGRTGRVVTFIFILFALCQLAFGWENHAQMTAMVLEEWASHDASMAQYLHHPVKAESLAAFLQATQKTLPAKLREIEHWLLQHESGYRPVPLSLIYDPTKNPCQKDLTRCFKKAIRINLDVPTPCVVYRRQGSLETIAEGSLLRREDVIAAGTLQPDLGFDLFLYEDNPSSFGKIYGFGTQPVGLQTPVASQILFHMSAYGESNLVLLMKPRLKENYPEARAYLYFSLSQFAKAAGHDYWSAIFSGWGLHYIQDMTQPYHTTLSLGLTPVSAFYMLAQNAVGHHKPFDDFKKIQENRHILLEKLMAWLLTDDPVFPLKNAGKPEYSSFLLASLQDYQLDQTIPPCDMSQQYIRLVMQPCMQSVASRYPALLHASLPSSYVDNPDFSAEKFNQYQNLFMHDMSAKQRKHFLEAMQKVLGLFGAYTRQCIRQQMMFNTPSANAKYAAG